MISISRSAPPTRSITSRSRWLFGLSVKLPEFGQREWSHLWFYLHLPSPFIVLAAVDISQLPRAPPGISASRPVPGALPLPSPHQYSEAPARGGHHRAPFHPPAGWQSVINWQQRNQIASGSLTLPSITGHSPWEAAPQVGAQHSKNKINNTK